MKDSEVMSAPEIEKPDALTSKWENERRAFLKLRPTLLQTYHGQFVAIHDGEVVDSGTNRLALALRVYDSVGYVPIYVAHVSEDERPPVRVPSPRKMRPQNAW